MPRIRGKYIALCEGDDYGTDPLKLQTLVEFMEGNEEYVMSFHSFNQLKGDNLELKKKPQAFLYIVRLSQYVFTGNSNSNCSLQKKRC